MSFEDALSPLPLLLEVIALQGNPVIRLWTKVNLPDQAYADAI